LGVGRGVLRFPTARYRKTRSNFCLFSEKCANSRICGVDIIYGCGGDLLTDSYEYEGELTSYHVYGFMWAIYNTLSLVLITFGLLTYVDYVGCGVVY